MYYIDTSVLAAYYCPEKFSDQAEEIISKNRCAISPLTQLELASVLSQKTKSKILSSQLSGSILNLFNQHIQKCIFKIHPLQTQHFSLAFEYLKRLQSNLRALDSLHAALCAAENYILVSSDKILVKESEILGINTLFIH